MQVKDYPLEKLIKYQEEYRIKLASAEKCDKRYTQTKLDITFYKAMFTLFNTEINSRIPF